MSNKKARFVGGLYNHDIRTLIMWIKRGVFLRGIAETECITSFGFGANVELWSLPTGNVKQEKMRNEEDAPRTCSFL